MPEQATLSPLKKSAGPWVCTNKKGLHPLRKFFDKKLQMTLFNKNKFVFLEIEFQDAAIGKFAGNYHS